MRKSIALLISAALIALSGCAATDSSGSGDSGGGGGLNAEASKPNKIVVGHAARLGDFKILKGWKVHNVGYGMGWEIKHLEVKNLTKKDHGFDVMFKLHKGPHRVIASINCIADTAHAGEIIGVDCLPDGRGKGFKFVTVENNF